MLRFQSARLLHVCAHVPCTMHPCAHAWRYACARQLTDVTVSCICAPVHSCLVRPCGHAGPWCMHHSNILPMRAVDVRRHPIPCAHASRCEGGLEQWQVQCLFTDRMLSHVFASSWLWLKEWCFVHQNGDFLH